MCTTREKEKGATDPFFRCLRSGKIGPSDFPKSWLARKLSLSLSLSLSHSLASARENLLKVIELWPFYVVFFARQGRERERESSRSARRDCMFF